MKNVYADYYLEYMNDFLTIEGFASYRGMSAENAQMIINLGRDYHIQRCSK